MDTQMRSDHSGHQPPVLKDTCQSQATIGHRALTPGEVGGGRVQEWLKSHSTYCGVVGSCLLPPWSHADACHLLNPPGSEERRWGGGTVEGRTPTTTVKWC